MSLRPIQIAAIALCALMAILFVYELTAPPAQFALPEVHLRPRAIALQTPAPFLAPPAAMFDAINQRSLFLPSRKSLTPPPVAGGAAPAGPPPLPNAALIGVILDGQNSLAMVKLSGAPYEQAMAMGASLGGWQIAGISSDHITLRSGAFTQDMHMDAKAGAAPGDPPAPNVPPPAGTQQ
ncbi:MAG TPA: hypothetical protein VHU87_15000 [Rhizomicrobium sp.]|jgi:hypothetical protein|nr:hypothetical protein [Rhizomicrobium sp.]